MNKVIYPITLDINFYLINQDGAVAKITTGFPNGSLPTHDQIVDKLNYEVTLMQGTGEGLQGSFRVCDYQEYNNAKFREINPIAAAGGPFGWLMPDDEIWYTSEGSGCKSCEPANFRKIASDLAEIVIWMSGSSDFGKEGQAYEGWLKAKTKLDDALKALGDTVTAEPIAFAEAKHDDPAALFAKLEGDSLDAIAEVMGEGNDFRQYNKGKSAMRNWFLGRLSRHLGIAWKRNEPVAEHKKAAPPHPTKEEKLNAANYHTNPTGLDADGRAED